MRQGFVLESEAPTGFNWVRHDLDSVRFF